MSSFSLKKKPPPAHAALSAEETRGNSTPDAHSNSYGADGHALMPPAHTLGELELMLERLEQDDIEFDEAA